jgi:pimeloyl-ACP methyl ester carboxylesterase
MPEKIAIRETDIKANGINIHVTFAGDGPTVLLCHGFPEIGYSWRHQIVALAQSGYRVLAPDMRGFGKTDAPDAITSYTVLHSVGDMIGVLDAFDAETAVIVGHDWGAPIAWTAAMIRPDRFHAVVGIAVPHIPRGATRGLDHWRKAGRHDFYQLYFQEPGRGEKDIESDLKAFLKGIFWSLSGGIDDAHRWTAFIPEQGFRASLCQPEEPLGWIDDHEMDTYLSSLTRNGLRGPLNWYRNIDFNWELHAAFQGLKIMQPALFIAGSRDPLLNWLRPSIERLSQTVPNLQDTIILPDTGHWTQQENPAAVNDALLKFLESVH